jgi:hypothetical protein
MPAEKRGFCLRSAASSVEPERGRPEMKCSRFCIGEGAKKKAASMRRLTPIVLCADCQAAFAARARRASITPRAEKPARIIAQVEGSGTIMIDA